MKELLEKAIEHYNEKVEQDPKLKEAMEGKVRTISIDIADGTCYNFTLENCSIGPLSEGTLEKADIRVTSDEVTLTGILKKEIKPLKAYLTKKVKFDASLEDLITLKKFF
jgi:putative sterol carrier protein